MAGAGQFEDGTLLPFIGNYNFLYASGWLLAISAFVVVAMSLMTPPPSEEQIKNLP